MSLPWKNVIVMDIETTDSSLEIGDALATAPISMALVKLNEHGDVINEWSKLIQPAAINNVTEYTEKFTGISKEQLKYCPSLKDLYQEIFVESGFGNLPVVAWNMQRDYQVIRNTMTYYDLEFPWKHTIDLCSYYNAYAGFIGFKPAMSQKAAAKRFGIVNTNRHSALGDAKEAASILVGLMEFS